LLLWDGQRPTRKSQYLLNKVAYYDIDKARRWLEQSTVTAQWARHQNQLRIQAEEVLGQSVDRHQWIVVVVNHKQWNGDIVRIPKRIGRS
jgi:hypothetical protein